MGPLDQPGDERDLALHAVEFAEFDDDRLIDRPTSREYLGDPIGHPRDELVGSIARDTRQAAAPMTPAIAVDFALHTETQVAPRAAVEREGAVILPIDRPDRHALREVDAVPFVAALLAPEHLI